MRIWKLVLGVALVFILGVLVGLLPRFYFKPPFPPPPPMDSRDRGSFLVGQLSRDLDLTDKQEAQVKAIVGQMFRKLDEHFQKVQPEVKAIFDEGFTEMGKVLSEPQKKKLADMRKKMEQHRMGGPGGPGGPRPGGPPPGRPGGPRPPMP